MNSDWHIKLQKKLPRVFIGKVLPILFLLIITIMYSRKLSYDDYGKFQSVWVFTNLIGTILLFGLPSIIFATASDLFKKYFNQYRNRIFGVYIIFSTIAFAVIYITASNFTYRFRFLLFGFILIQAACSISDTFLIKRNMLKPYLWINTLYAISFFIIHLYFYYSLFSLTHLIFSVFVLAFIKLIIIKSLKVKPAGNHQGEVTNLFFKNWLFTGINDIFGVLTRWLDKLLVLYLLSPADFAVFFNGSFEFPLFVVLISAMENIMLSNISENLSDKNEAWNIFKESFKVLSLISFPIFFFFLITHQEAYSIIFNNRYNASIPVFLVSIFIIPLRISHYGVILQCYGKAGKLAFGSAMDIVISIILMLILYPHFGTRGIVLGLVVSTYIQVLYYLIQSAKVLKVTLWDLVPFKYLVKLFTALGAFYFVLNYTKKFLTPFGFLSIIFLITACIIVIALYRYFFCHKNNFQIDHK